MWVLERDASRVYLFGEVVGRRDGAWLTDAVRSAVESSRELWCEVDRDAVQRSPSLAAHAIADEPLSERLDPAGLEHVREVGRGVGVDVGTLDGLRPWIVAQLLEQALLADAGVDAASGAEATITRLAEARGIPIRWELDGAEAALAWFGGMDRELEIDYLRWVAEEVAGGRKRLDRRVDAWTNGELGTTEQEVEAMRRDFARLHDRLVVDRNHAWVPRIETMLDTEGVVFVVVGAGHLVGRDGILGLLTDAGLEPRRLNGSTPDSPGS